MIKKLSFISIHRILRMLVLGFAGFGMLTAVTIGFIILQNPSVGQAADDDDIFAQLSFFNDAFALIHESYVENVSNKQLVQAAINGMLTDLDPHSSYLPADEFEKMQQRTQGEFGGLGIEVTMEDGYVKVIAALDDTPAMQAGILTGDLVVMIEGEDVFGLTLDEAVNRMRGKVGEDITLTIKREERDVFDVTLTRDIIKLRSVRFDTFEGVGYIRITNFSKQTTPGVFDAVASLKKSHGRGLLGIVIDLRNNPGGLLNEAVKVTDAFLDKGTIVSTKGRQSSSNSHFKAKNGDIAAGLPIVVLINGGSASASEIVAGALKDHGRAIIMGEKSFGKGSVQSIIPVNDKGAIRLTTARYYTPTGISIQSTGIEPNIHVEFSIKDDDTISDTDEENPIELKLYQYDEQVTRAVDLIKGITQFNSQKIGNS